MTVRKKVVINVREVKRQSPGELRFKEITHQRSLWRRHLNRIIRREKK